MLAVVGADFWGLGGPSSRADIDCGGADGIEDRRAGGACEAGMAWWGGYSYTGRGAYCTPDPPGYD